jgi:hypothetical protein
MRWSFVKRELNFYTVICIKSPVDQFAPFAQLSPVPQLQALAVHPVHQVSVVVHIAVSVSYIR